MDNRSDRSDHDTQLQLEMAMPAFSLLKAIKEALEAATYGEVIRRAIQLYGSYDVDLSLAPARSGTSSERGIKRLHVRIPPRTIELMESRKAGAKSNSAVITEALLLLAQVLRNQGRLEWTCDRHDSKPSDSDVRGDKHAEGREKHVERREKHDDMLLTA